MTSASRESKCAWKPPWVKPASFIRSATPMPCAPFSRSRTEAFFTIRAWVSCLCSFEYRIAILQPIRCLRSYNSSCARKKLHLFRFWALAHHRERGGGVHCEIAGSVADKALGIAGLAAEFYQPTFRRNGARPDRERPQIG